MRQHIGGLFLRLLGWRALGEAPAAPRCVMIAAPHTSNWDLVFMLAFAWHYELRPRFMMKHSVFVGPAGWLFRRLGGIPIDRRTRKGVTDQMVEALESSDELLLLVPAEGTRVRAEYWKSGFYHIARKAKVPVVMSFLDYGRKEAGFGPAIQLTGDYRHDMDAVRAFYAGRLARYPAQVSPIRLREEIEQDFGDGSEAGGGR